ncbi:MAG: cytochrome c biogenesis protein ResB [Actinomycetota bacterium]
MSSSQRYESPEIGLTGWTRWVWRQLTSMRTALLLLLMLAAAAVPGSIYPQRSADPNGVAQFFDRDPALAEILDFFQLFDVYSSIWFSAIYILLFTSLVGCVLPRTKLHFEALKERPVETPSNLSRMPAYLKQSSPGGVDVLERANEVLIKRRFRVSRQDNSISAEKGYSRESGNLIFHLSLVGVLIAVGVGGGLSFSGQRVLVEGETFVNNLSGFDSLSPGVFFDPERLGAFSVSLDKFDVDYDFLNETNIGAPLDFRATVTIRTSPEDEGESSVVRVNHPLDTANASVYLTGHGYAPVITVRDGNGEVSFSGPTVFLPQDSNMTSIGIIKVPDNLPEQIGIVAFFYPTAAQLETGAYTSVYPDVVNPILSMNVYTGDLGLDSGVPLNVYALDTDRLTQVAGRQSDNPGIVLQVGETKELPNGLGSVTFEGIKKFASLDIAHNPGQIWVLLFSLIALAGVILSLLTPRRRIWVKKVGRTFEVAGLSKRDDPKLEEVVRELMEEIRMETK